MLDWWFWFIFVIRCSEICEKLNFHQSSSGKFIPFFSFFDAYHQLLGHSTVLKRRIQSCSLRKQVINYKTSDNFKWQVSLLKVSDKCRSFIFLVISKRLLKLRCYDNKNWRLVHKGNYAAVTLYYLFPWTILEDHNYRKVMWSAMSNHLFGILIRTTLNILTRFLTNTSS